MPTPKGKRLYSVAEVAAALQKTRGLITLAAAEMHADYKTVKRMVNESPTLQRAQTAARCQMVDFAEGKLYEAIGHGEPWAIQFYLRTQAKDRGYADHFDLGAFLRERAVELATARGAETAPYLVEAERIIAEHGVRTRG